LYWDQFKQMASLFPPYDEQAAIVWFLDYVNQRLEQTIRAKRKVVALLNEQKQAIIYRAVTRGLDPNVPLKPSDIPWLSEIPAHWEVIPLKFLSRRIRNGATPSTAEQGFYVNGTVAWFGPSSIGADILVGKPVRHLAPTAFAHGKARLINGPAILVIVIGATAGKMALLDGEGATNQQITAFELREEKVVPHFCLQQLRFSESWLRSTASTATIPILDSGIVMRLPVAFPSHQDQQAILASVDNQIQPFDMAISRAKCEIALLREYRTRLIADVVTGKLDVREAARQLPIEADEPETLIDTDLLDEGEESFDGDVDMIAGGAEDSRE
jgi:type I restriction enzyme S subunit